MKKNTLIFICLFLIIPVRIFATAQILDRLIYKGETYRISATPLEQLYKDGRIRPKFFENGEMSTACRGYYAEWTIEDNKLYLTDIYSCGYNQDHIKADLKKIFGVKYKGGKVLADWVNDTFYTYGGKLLYYIQEYYTGIYAKELEFSIKNGLVSNFRELDNSKTRISKYFNDGYTLREYLRKNINYDSIPDPEYKVSVFVHIESISDDGKIDSVRITRGFDYYRNSEAIRVVKSIPEWNVLYLHGKRFSPGWVISVTFGKNTNLEKKSQP